MNTQQFEDTLRQLKHREPFVPFVVELLDGRVIQVPRPKMVITTGAASFLTEDFDLVEFTCDEVRTIRAASNGAA